MSFLSASSARYGANAYQRVGLETGVTSADPHKLILMLFDGAVLAVATAETHLAAGNAAGKAECVSKASRIISEGLRASLDMNAGGELAARLVALYDYMCNRLLYANVKDDAAALVEVRHLLSELKEAWEQIGGATGGAPREAGR